MSKFSILVGHDVPHYGEIEIHARDADHALEILQARPLCDTLDEACYDPAFDSSICARVVYIRDEDGNCSHEDTPLDNSYREWGAVSDLISALQKSRAFVANFSDDYEAAPPIIADIDEALTAAGVAERQDKPPPDPTRYPAGLFVYARDLFDALDGCIEQMAQCEKLLSDDREFTAALAAARAARSKAGAP